MHPEELKDAFLAWLHTHRLGCGDATCAEPANTLAYIAHCAGLRTTQLGEFKRALAEYEADCVGCSHMRN